MVEKKKYVVGLGGTFDHLHEGHKKLLEVAFNIGKKVVVGLATDKLLVDKEYKEHLEPYDIRKTKLLKFAESIGRKQDLTIIPLDDPFGPAITDPILEVHVSSEETFDISRKMNDMRVKNGLPPLILVMVPMVLREDGVRFSSTSIRKDLARSEDEK
ncbi:MAG: pantetheine-phosphate adenylyltransferase [Promethearchaeota archaeon]